jgi:hypothetical protein
MKNLGYQPDAVNAAMTALPGDSMKPEFTHVFVFSGHMIDAANRLVPRFPPDKEPAVRKAIMERLERWNVGEGDLALSGAAQGGDILFAEICRERKAHVRLLLAEPGAAYLKDSVRGRAPSWEDRFFSLKQSSEVRVQPEELGEPPESVSPHARNNLWLLNTARVEATPERLFALFVWDRKAAPGLYGTSHFAERVEELGGRLEIVNPMEL